MSVVQSPYFNAIGTMGEKIEALAGAILRLRFVQYQIRENL